jgi:GT2 family glycosyltransferase
MSKTAIVILNWNGVEFLKKFLATVIRHSEIPGVEIIIADNGSSDGSIEWLTKNHPGINIIRLEKNHGFAGGYNLALEQVDAQYYVLLNSDIEVTTGWLAPLISWLEENPGYASCQPKILSYDRKEYFEHAGAAGGFIDKYGYPFCRGRIFDHVEKDSGQYDDQVDIFWSTGACMAVRAEAWKKCGGFDASFFAHMEEIDLCWRFHKSGYRIAYIPGSKVFHVGGGALPYHSPYKLYLNFRNSLFFLYKNLSPGTLTKTLFIRKMLDGIAATSFLLKGSLKNFRSVWRAHMDFYHNKRELKQKRKLVMNLGNSDFNAPILNKSIVFEFYAKGCKTYDSLKTDFLK